MKSSWLKLYDAPSATAPLRFATAAAVTRNKVQRLSLLNRQRDYRWLLDHPGLLPLHRRLNEHLLHGATEWPSYDYGEGYFYQSMSSIGVSGLRDSQSRIDALDLPRYVQGRRVLEIGCNTGFLTLLLAQHATSVTAFDISPRIWWPPGKMCGST